MVIETMNETLEIDLSEIESIEFSGFVDADFIEIISRINFKLDQNFPNPFNPETTINFSMEKSGKVDLVIFNSKGQKIKTLFAEKMHSGNHSIIWKGKDENNMQVASGIYFYKLTIGNQTITKKLILLK